VDFPELVGPIIATKPECVFFMGIMITQEFNNSMNN